RSVFKANGILGKTQFISFHQRVLSFGLPIRPHFTHPPVGPFRCGRMGRPLRPPADATIVNASLFGLLCFAFLLLTPIDSIANQDGADNRLETEVGWVGLGGEARRLRENHFGDRWDKRLNLLTVLSSRSRMNEHVAFFLEPVFTKPRGGTDTFLRRGYLRIVDANTALKVGRESLWWGPGRHGALLLSNNAFPFDLIQLGSDLPFHLPGFLSGIGTFEITAFLTELESSRAIRAPRLFGLRIGYHPSDWVSIGASRITIFGGEGRGLSLRDFFKVYFSDPNRSGKLDVNELAALDLQLQLPLNRFLPGHHLELYAEWGGEDEAGLHPTKSGILTGMAWTFSGKELIVEYADNNINGDGAVWYRHSVYQSGYTYRGEIIGHHMGPDADSFFVRAGSPLSEKWVVGFDYEKERHGLSEPIQEKFARLGGDLVYLHTPKQTYSFRFQFERIKNLGPFPNIKKLRLSPNTVRNHYAIVSVAVTF
ncbi:MAG: capsule assembly Wzi family protein, partial [Nitrospiria bacterium]